MRKIGIITLNGYYNYGNRLQNYALQEILKKLNFKVETIIKENEISVNKNQILKRISRLIEYPMPIIFNSLSNKVLEILFRNRIKKRTDIFKEFSKKYINETDFTISINSIPKELPNNYDFFVVGSDQVWNPYFQKGSPIEFLTFAPVEKRIAYAASFGVSSIPEEYQDLYRNYLSQIKYISVREYAGAKIIKDLTNKQVDVVLDPTLLLSKNEWLEISEAPSDKPVKNYLLTYFLGDISRKRKKYIRNIACKYDLEIVNLASIFHKNGYLTGPSEFIDYINSASLFFTDSFHGAAFSIMLNTPFIVFDREGKSPSMNSRIETLLNTFDMKMRYFDNFNDDVDLLNVDFSQVESILLKEKTKSLNYLKHALNI